MNYTELHKKLMPILTVQLAQTSLDWLTEGLQACQVNDSHDTLDELLFYSASAKRKLKTSSDVVIELEDRSFALVELVRILLIAKSLDCEQIAAQTKSYYQFADESEKCALLKGLNWLDASGDAVQIAIRAARCNSLVEFSALALDNPYPSSFFPALNYNQLVLKAIFMGLDISKVINLQTRLNQNLSNMCFAYLIEQALAQRTPPASIWLAIRLADLNAEHCNQAKQYIEHFYHGCSQHQLQIEQMLQIQDKDLFAELKH
ncbi:EboA domain-containing protein [Catenovulum sediminis]|uniref:EboA domain-containing protein n=1 Tax=Catenovulum sediminis TaxID=1740262 RepID=A0ABV1RHM4_9ALTE|nr:EboA domain-containing protein [Catenovulum sediminis]